MLNDALKGRNDALKGRDDDLKGRGFSRAERRIEDSLGFSPLPLNPEED